MKAAERAAAPGGTSEATAAPERGLTPSRPRWWCNPWLPAVLGAVVYLNSLPNELVYDDQSYVVHNTAIRSLANLSAIWLSDFAYTEDPEMAQWQAGRDLLYRPLTTFSFAIDYAWHGIWAEGFRTTNILLHGIVCVLMWYFARRLLHDEAAATVAALLFAVHPIHVEAVVLIAGRAEQLVALFLLLGLLVMMRREDRWATFFAAPLFLLGLLAKESAICYVPVGLLVLYERQRRVAPDRGDSGAEAPVTNGRGEASLAHRMQSGATVLSDGGELPGARESGLGRWLWQGIGLILPVLVYLPLRYAALGALRRAAEFNPLNPLASAEAGERLLTPFTILGHYVRLFFFPWTLSVDYSYAVIDPQRPDALTLLGVAAGFALLVGLPGYLRKEGAWRKAAVLCAIWLASYALFSNTFLLIGATLAERFMYWPSVPVLMLVALGLVQIGQRLTAAGLAAPRDIRIGGGIVVAVLVALLAGRTYARNLDWRTGLRLFTIDAGNWPRSMQLNANAARLHFKLASETEDQAARREALERADHYAWQALRFGPNLWPHHLSRSVIRRMMGDLEGATAHARRALELSPDAPSAQALLGTLLGDQKRFAEAVPLLEAAYKAQPDKLGYLETLTRALLAGGEEERAIERLRELAEKTPETPQPHALLARLLRDRDPEAAVQHGRRLVELQPEDLGAKLLLADALAAAGRSEEARSLFTAALDAFPPEDPLRAEIEKRLTKLGAAPTTQPPDGP